MCRSCTVVCCTGSHCTLLFTDVVVNAASLQLSQLIIYNIIVYQNTRKSEEWLSEFEIHIPVSIKTLRHYNSVVKYIYTLLIACNSVHLAYASTSILQITTIILYYLNFKILVYRFRKFLKTYLMYNTSYNIPLWCKAKSHWNRLQHCNI